MRFTKFIISNYRAITGPLEINIDRKSLIPIIGINESGKTTILQAIFAFDYYNDELNEGGRHLKDTSNLYKTASPPATIEAQIEATRYEIISAVEESEEVDLKSYAATMKKWPRYPTPLRIVRNLKSLTYSMPEFPSQEKEDAVAKALIQRQLPFILYFDDFRDKIEERIEIVDSKKSAVSGWLAIIEQLFKQTDDSLSVFSLPSLEERQRKSVLAKVQRHLNQTLTREWENFRLDDREALEIAIDLVQDPGPNNTKRNYIKLDVVETDANGDRHFFFLSDRSKGFFWFFNFVMKLEFNPKVLSQDDRTIILLDEPGSYLHASAQTKLCDKLVALSRRNTVVYCTHSHYLLSPDKIPFGNIFVAGKDGTGNISMIAVHEYRGNITETRSAFQPLSDALRIRPFALDTLRGPVVITEGIYDYFVIELLKQDRSIRVLPSVGADSIKFYISLMLTWSIPFKALWDNDPAGRSNRTEAISKFGDDLTRDKLFLIPLIGNQRNRILQDLFDGSDLRIFRNRLGIPANTSFEKTIVTLFYSDIRDDILAAISQTTRENFDQLFWTLRV